MRSSLSSLPRPLLLATLVWASACSAPGGQDAPASDAELLFGRPTASSSSPGDTLSFPGYMLENNCWNAGALAPGTWSQSVYRYDGGGRSLSGWRWSYPDTASGVNAYPEIIFGWKPWFGASTTTALPLQVSAVKGLKARYAATLQLDRPGAYDLAFDNWICSAAVPSPSNLKFEFMIWEDFAVMGPFGAYVETVTTSNGVYDFYMGTADWGAPGVTWTYLAFQRQSPRRAGTVDVDELLRYLVETGVVPSTDYLSSVEFGLEAGNCAGSCLLSAFDVTLSATVPAMPARSLRGSMYLRGDMNGWGTIPMRGARQGGDEVWTADAILAAASTYGFKFDHYGDWSESWGYGGAGQPLTAAPGAPNVQFTSGAAGTYRFTFNRTQLTWSVAP